MSGEGNFSVINWVKSAHADRALEFSERVVLAHLMFAAGHAGECRRSHRHISEALGIDPGYSQRITKKLHRLQRLEKHRLGLTLSNLYRMPWHPEFGSVLPAARPAEKAKTGAAGANGRTHA